MHLLQKHLIKLLICTICVGVTKQSVVELIKTDVAHTDRSSTIKPEDNSSVAVINGTSHRKGRCKLKGILCVIIEDLEL